MKTHAIGRHSYAIKVLGKLPGFFQPQRYSYYCVRCKWSFLVNDGRRGVVTALDASGKPLERPEAAERAEDEPHIVQIKLAQEIQRCRIRWILFERRTRQLLS